MPGQSTCFKCGSTLAEKADTVEVNPPRMARWKKPLRCTFRRLRIFHLIPAGSASIPLPPWLDRFSREGLFGILLSIIPGLAHLLQGRLKEIRWYVLAWFVSLVGSLFFYGGFFGSCLFGLAVGLHAWIAIHSALIKQVSGFGHRLFALVLVSLGVLVIYRNVGSLIFSDLVGGYCSVTIPYHKVEAEDYLLASRSRLRSEPIIRGILVVAYLEDTRHRFWPWSGERRDMGIAQIIGLPGEKLEIKDKAFWINDEQLDVEKYPLPAWLHNTTMSVTIPKSRYFVSAAYNIVAHGRGLEALDVTNVCLVGGGNFEAKAFMRWSPLIRRGFIREME
jgi:hypothetical protein